MIPSGAPIILTSLETIILSFVSVLLDKQSENLVESMIWVALNDAIHLGSFKVTLLKDDMFPLIVIPKRSSRQNIDCS